MSERKRSQKGFVAVTLITLLAIALVLLVYASLLTTFTGGEVVVGTVTGDVYYSENNATAGPWTATLSVSGPTDDWYARIVFTSTYTGAVEIIWQLQTNDPTWTNVTGATQSTSVVLDGSGNQPVYASPNGLLAANYDWGGDVSENGQYRVIADVKTAS